MSTEFFIVANSFAAPFFSDTSEHFVKAATPKKALEKLVKTYKHHAGLYVAGCWKDANSYHKGRKMLARWICNVAKAKEDATKGMGAYSMLGISAGEFEVNGVRHKVKDPRGGKVDLAS